ncbi:transmembrane protein 170A isoform X3 [Peromyscus eremicus]|uniref:transmembrane protein 170A isoform X3 n=1 Tax=Peromyscus eremicus TaxID=42410 RepID=UPI0027DBF846|nr:transmembrane protein 170A isoform X3 [Peromyscus eremicus]
MEPEGSGGGGGGGSAGLMQQILSLKLVPRVGNGTLCPNSTSLCSFPEKLGQRHRQGRREGLRVEPGTCESHPLGSDCQAPLCGHLGPACVVAGKVVVAFCGS